MKKHVFILCISGVSIQFLCSPRPEEPIEHVTACLQALHTLLDSPYARVHIAEDQVQCIAVIDNCLFFSEYCFTMEKRMDFFSVLDPILT